MLVTLKILDKDCANDKSSVISKRLVSSNRTLVSCNVGTGNPEGKTLWKTGSCENTNSFERIEPKLRIPGKGFLDIKELQICCCRLKLEEGKMTEQLLKRLD